jgi:hypothetical protein
VGTRQVDAPFAASLHLVYNISISFAREKNKQAQLSENTRALTIYSHVYLIA